MFIKNKSSSIYAFLEAHLSNQSQSMLGHLYLLDSTTSTNDFLLERASSHLPDFSLCVADTQTKGRGRLDHTWLSTPYNGIYASIYWQPTSLLTLEAFSLFLGTQIIAALNANNALNMQLKWPNDIYLNQKKLAGILIETRPPNHVVIGFGLNIRSAAVDNSTCLMDEGFSDLSHPQVLGCIINHLLPAIRSYHQLGFAPYLSDFEKLDMLKGRHITMNLSGKTCSGIAQGIDQNGMLIVKESNGKTISVLNASNIRLTQEKH